MSYNKRIPPIKVELTIEKFNSLIEFLSVVEEEEQKEVARKLKGKILKYSIPSVTESDTFIVIRFFNQEIMQLVHMLISNLNYSNIENNYYEILIENRINKKEMI